MSQSDRARASVCPFPPITLSLLAVLLAGPACAGDPGPGGDCATDDCSADGSVGSVESAVLNPTSATTGSVAVTLVPGPSATVGSPSIVTFGAPFPPGDLTSTGMLRAFDGAGHELPIYARSLLPWRVWPGHAGTASIRAAEVSIKITLASRSPVAIQLRWGSAPAATMAAPSDPRAAWVYVADGEYPSSTVREPRVYASFPPSWLGNCMLRSRTTAVHSDTTWSWLDDALLGYAHTAVNDVPSTVTERINYTTDYEPWLFDRSGTLFNAYARTGDVAWLRHAHRSAQFYRRHVTAGGWFDIKGGQDLKYSYGHSLLVDYIFTGDPALLTTIRAVAAAGATWNPTYSIGTNFWTERHQTYALLAALAAWEATGDQSYADRASAIARTSFAMAANPVNGWHADGCMLHTMDSHEGAGGTSPICSPWMSALFADAVWDYYTVSRDPAALTFLSKLGDYVRGIALYPGGDGLSLTMPWYLASSVKKYSDAGPWDDAEHTCDVAGLVARAAWARRTLGGDATTLRATATTLLTGCKWDLSYWHRPGVTGKAEWRLSPGRKFNWWFGTTSDLPWLMAGSL